MVMAVELRKTGISVVGDVPWGTHFCCFYETKEDLLDILVPYFKVGLENDEFCLWVISKSELLTMEEATSALGKALPDLDRYIAEERIQVIAHDEWFLEGRAFDLHRVVNRFKQKVDEALAKGYAGIRVNGSPAWIQKEDGKELLEFEGELDKLFPSERIIASCTYPLAGSKAAGLLDVIRTHQFAVARRHGIWEVIETPELKQAKDEINRLNEELEQRVVERTRELAVANEKLRTEIAERKQIEEALRESESRLQLALDAARMGCFEWDLVSGKIIWSSVHANLFGLDPNSFRGTYQEFDERIHPEDRETLNAAVARARDERTFYSHEYRIIWPDGTVHWVTDQGQFFYGASGKPVRMSGLVMDITERKLAEEKLRKSEAQLAEAQQLAQLGSWSRELATNVVTWSDEIFRIFGMEPQKVGPTYQAFLERVHPDDRTAVRAVIEDAFKHHRPFSCEYRVTRLDGAVRIIHERGSVVVDDAGKPIRAFGTAQDITERKHAEEELRTSREDLRALAAYLQSVREEERTRISRELHDEIGQGLTAIKLALQRCTAGQSGAAAELVQALDLANELIGRVRDLSLELRPSMLDDLGLLAALRWHFGRYTAQCKIDVDFKYTGLDDRRFSPEIETAAYRIVQEALTNVARHAQIDKVAVEIDADRDRLRIQIKDRGVGFDPHPLSAARTAGLSGMRERAIILGGKLEIQSSPGAGTVLTAILPLNINASSA
jgi:PAS domain S-box-containing protein